MRREPRFVAHSSVARQVANQPKQAASPTNPQMVMALQRTQSATEQSIADLAKRIDDFLNNLENALHVPYDMAHAQKDYEAILFALNHVHKNMEEHSMLNVSPEDTIKSDKPNVSPEALLKAALDHKASVDAEFEKIANAARAAKARGDA